MEYKKRLKSRLYLGIGYIVLGIILIMTTFIWDKVSEYFSPLGLILAVMGVVRVRNYFIITRSEESIRKREIVETDERNVAISQKSKAMAFNLFTVLACVAVIVLTVAERIAEAQVISYSVLVLILLYWIGYWIYRRKL